MNIFIFDLDIQKNVQQYCDKHVVKMLLETAQIICTVRHHYGFSAPYKPTHKNHPCVKWAIEDYSNYDYLLMLLEYLNDEYKYRYDKDVNHKSYEKIISILFKPFKEKSIWDYDCFLEMPIDLFNDFVQCIPNQYKQEDVCKAYQDYFNGEKQHIAKWTKRPVPAWFKKK